MISSAYGKLNRLIAVLTLGLSFAVYFMTMAPTVSYWDCGEFIATSYTMGVPHPPGSPMFLLLGRIFTMIPFNADIAYRMNLMSPVMSALAVMLLYLITVKFITHWRGEVNNKMDALVVFGSAFVGALTFAVTDSHWFNAVEAEVYSLSTFFTAIVVWLILHWAERADESGHERYILIIAYMIGMATGIHLLNLLALPFISLIFYYRKMTFQWKTFFIMIGITGAIFVVIHNGIIKGLPQLASVIGLFGLAAAFIVFTGVMIWSVLKKHQLLSLCLSSAFLILIGYSSYIMIFIRSGQNPNIDENNPETVERAIAYLEREQYGAFYQFPRRYPKMKPKNEIVGTPEVIVRDNRNRPIRREFSSRQERKYKFHDLGRQWEYFWSYQVNKMYWRYFLWQFAGRGPNDGDGGRVSEIGAKSREDGVDWLQFGVPFALIFGLWGMIHQFKRDPERAFTVLTLFLMTGLAIILYINQDNPQPRERDYSYVGSFLAFSIWIGAGVAALSELIEKKIKNRDISFRLSAGALAALLFLMPGVMTNANYHSHNRAGNYVAWDYSYNLLQSCEPNGILFTNGDNDTFPLWYLQEVEKVRTDVTVANLSLLNTSWYIKQLRDLRRVTMIDGQERELDRFVNISDQQIADISSGLTRWEKKNIRISVLNDPQNELGYIEWEVKPTYANIALRVQDLMILRILNDSKWQYPVYFAVTVPASNRVGLEKFLEMEGLVYRVQSHEVNYPQDPINAERMEELLVSDVSREVWDGGFSNRFWQDSEGGIWSRGPSNSYLFRNMGNEDIYYNKQVIRLMQNYRSAYMQLAAHHYLKARRLDDKTGEPARRKVAEIINEMSENIPENTVPMESKELHYQMARILGEVGETAQLDSILSILLYRDDTTLEDRIEYGRTYMSVLKNYDKSSEVFSALYQDLRALRSRGHTTDKGLGRKWKNWHNFYPTIVNFLAKSYQESEKYNQASEVLEDWLREYPQDASAKSLLEEIRTQIEKG
ncbi:MAG: DUF2723 domain-containing protein [Candidatus Marinimicrobia bacterium]|nr:DUF2723 domain-containing protein [Candidatus Neomarinimicrobiota bacterium]MDP6789187.1 DUF2723 domain-containing protein [Candidatus Neomarinimicrobiota bacterium]MDP7072817.1 DUF2723 domain-containing protein [Candidatus Neomarinimicrobiota bacterium]